MKDQKLQNQIDCFLNETINDADSKELEKKSLNTLIKKVKFILS